MKTKRQPMKNAIKKAQQVYNKFLFDSHLKTLREVELQGKRIANLENRGTAELETEIQDLTTRHGCLVKNTSTDMFNAVRRVEQLEKDVKTRGEDFRRLAQRVILLEGNVLIGMKADKDLETAIHRLETHVKVIESNASVACECSNKQATVITNLQKELEYAKIRLARCQDSVASLDPLGSVIVRKRGGPKKSS